ncbi:MAG: inositol monophosphatase family protein [Micrococcaceae bacterium]
MTDDAASPDIRATALMGLAREAARSAAPALLEAFRAPQDHLGVTTKSNDHDVVTLLDRATEDLLVARLTEALPGSRVLGEEGGVRGGKPADADTAADGGADRAVDVEWIIDPIDGTSNFVHGFVPFSISIAAAVHGTVRAGVVLDPVNGLEFSADDDGAYLNGAPLTPRPAPDSERRYNLVTSFPSAENLAHQPARCLELFGRLVQDYATLRRTVSGAMELCYTAAGWSDVTLALATHPWDIAAGQLILTRAGGTVHGRGYPAEVAGRLAPHLAPHLLGVAPGRTTAAALEQFEQIVAAVEPAPEPASSTSRALADLTPITEAP